MSLLLIVFGIAALLFAAVFFIRFGFFATCLVALATGTVLGPPFFQVSLITLDRLIIGGLAVAYVTLRTSSFLDRKPITSWDYLFATFLAALAFCTFTNDWKMYGFMPASRLIFFYLMPAAMYWLGRQASVTERTLFKLYCALGLFGLYLAGTAICEWRQLYGLVFPKYIISPDHVEFLGRGRGPLLNPVGNGVLMCLCLGGLMMLWSYIKPLAKIGLIPMIGIVSIGIFATLTRCVWIAYLLSGLLILMTAFPKNLRIPALVVSAMMLAILVGLNWNKLNSFKRDKNVSVSDMSKSSSLRPVLAYIAWQMFLDNPISGVGLGQYKEHDQAYMADRSSELVLDMGRPYVQHNTFLSLLTETGVLGLGLFIACLATWSRAAWALWRERSYALPVRQLGLLFLVLMISYVVNSLFHDMTLIPMMNMVLFFFAGLTIGQYVKQIAGSYSSVNKGQYKNDS